jgi:hypothetical protein
LLLASANGPSWTRRLPSTTRTVVPVAGSCNPAPLLTTPDACIACTYAIQAAQYGWLLTRSRRCSNWAADS